MTIDEKLTRLGQEIDSLSSVVDLALEDKPETDKQGIKLQIAARFEHCEGILKSVRKDIADKGQDDPVRAAVRTLRDRLSALLDRYEGEPDTRKSQTAAG